jgi:hypothetical protein
MRVQWALACQALELDGALAHVTGAGVDAVFPPELPARISLVALARIAARIDEAGTPAHIEAHLLGPGMDAVASLEFDLTMDEPNPQHPEGWEMTVFMPLVIDFEAVDEGAHGLEIRINDKLQRDVIWWVVRLPETAAEA